MIRDGRDVHLSMKNLPWGPNNAYTSALYWKSVMSFGQKMSQQYPSRWLSTRYEDLLQSPESTLRKICEFLNVSYEPDMLNFYKSADKKLPSQLLKTQFSKTTSPIDPKNCYKWRTRLEPWEMELFETVCGDELLKAGYELTLENPAKPGSHRLAYYRFQDLCKRIWNLVKNPVGGRAVLTYGYLKPALYRLTGFPQNRSAR